MAKLPHASHDRHVLDAQVRIPTHGLDHFLEQLLGFRGALRRHQDLGILRVPRARKDQQARGQQQAANEKSN
jgi:hypothetical protein